MANKIKNIKLGNVKYDIYDNTALHQGDAVGSVSSVVGLTGDVTVASIATALATAGYKLTDTDTNTWQAANSSQVGYVPASTANKILRADNTGALYWGDDSNTTYTLVGLMGGTAKGGATQPIYWDGSAFQNTTYTLGKSVPSDAVFTDTTYVFNSTYNASTNKAATMADIPSSLPASDVSAWAKAETKPSYTLDEVSDGSTRKLSNYLPLSGGTITGNLIISGSDIPEVADNFTSYASTHSIKFYRNGFLIPYQLDSDNNDGGFFRVRGTNESNTICEIGTWDDFGEGETIQFNYYPTTSTINPTYSVSVPKATGTLALTSDIPSYSAGTGLSLSGTTFSLATSGVTAGTYKRVTVDAYGRVTAGDNTDANDNTQYYLTLNGSVAGTSGTTNLGTIYAPTTAGTSGYYLKSNGSGAPTWAAIQTGGVSSVTVGSTSYTPSSGVVTVPNYATYTTTDSNVTSIDASLSTQALRKVAQQLTTTEKTQVLTNLGISGAKNITISSVAPQDNQGDDGDIWIVYEE